MTEWQLNATDLLHGAIYALEHAGQLLHDAHHLFLDERYSSAVALAVYCREELGRADILFDLRRQSLQHGPIGVSEVRKRCVKHIERLRRGQKVAVVRLGPEQWPLLVKFASDPHSPEYAEARKTIGEMQRSKKRRDPTIIERLRYRALYVEPSEFGQGWNRPSSISSEQARILLQDVATDYEEHRRHLPGWDSELKAALEAWTDAPDLRKPL